MADRRIACRRRRLADRRPATVPARYDAARRPPAHGGVRSNEGPALMGIKHIILYVAIAVVVIGGVWFMMRSRANRVG